MPDKTGSVKETMKINIQNALSGIAILVVLLMFLWDKFGGNAAATETRFEKVENRMATVETNIAVIKNDVSHMKETVENFDGKMDRILVDLSTQ